MKAMHSVLDANNDGNVEDKELVAYVRNLHGKDEHHEMLVRHTHADLIRRGHRDKNQSFADMFGHGLAKVAREGMRIGAEAQRHARALFGDMDQDGNGVVTTRERASHHVRRDKAKVVDQVRIFVQEHDLDMDGVLNVEEMQDVRLHRMLDCFADTDWEDALEQRVPPPYVPEQHFSRHKVERKKSKAAMDSFKTLFKPYSSPERQTSGSTRGSRGSDGSMGDEDGGEAQPSPYHAGSGAAAARQMRAADSGTVAVEPEPEPEPESKSKPKPTSRTANTPTAAVAVVM
eukprot:g5844.t1